MSLKRRLKWLEERSEARAVGGEDAEKRRRVLALHFKSYENARRELEGSQPLPLTEEEERWEWESDQEFLAEHLPQLRADPGWQDKAARAVLDYWEEDTKRRLGQ